MMKDSSAKSHKGDTWVLAAARSVQLEAIQGKVTIDNEVLINKIKQQYK